jgi:hypothetical protein
MLLSTKSPLSKATCFFVFYLVGVAQVLGQNNALDFGAADDYIDVENIDLSGTNQAFSLEAWVKLTGTNSYLFTFNPDEDGANTYFLLDMNSGKARFRMRIPPGGTGGTTLLSTTDINDGNWHHLAATYDGFANMKLYVDGIEEGSTSVAATPGYIIDLRIGRNFPNTTNAFSGQLDEARIWNDVRSTTEIQDNLNKELIGSEQGLIAYYNFNSGISESNNFGVTSLIDQTANSYDGTLFNFDLSGTNS